MKISHTDHRPWALPQRPWIMAQVWRDLLFAHWPVRADDLRRLVPPPLTLDTYEGQGWITVAAFRMSGIRLRGLFPLPLLSASLELNVRTYVTVGNCPGVFFFSLDADNRAGVALGRLWYHLPYFRAEMSLRHFAETIHYSSRRLGRNAPAAEFVCRYRPVGEVFRSVPGTLDHWLTERYCLYSIDSRDRVCRAEIHHAPWPLQPAAAEIDVNRMTIPLGLALPAASPLLHFAPKLEVVVWSPERVSELQ